MPSVRSKHCVERRISRPRDALSECSRGSFFCAQCNTGLTSFPQVVGPPRIVLGLKRASPRSPMSSCARLRALHGPGNRPSTSENKVILVPAATSGSRSDRPDRPFLGPLSMILQGIEMLHREIHREMDSDAITTLKSTSRRLELSSFVEIGAVSAPFRLAQPRLRVFRTGTACSVNSR